MPSVVTAKLRQNLKERRRALVEQFLHHPHPQQYLHKHAHLVDESLAELSDSLLPEGLCLVAVGGYGRGELFPASDVDVLVLIPQEPDAAQQEKLETWVRCCWDAGLEIGHSVRTPAQCADEANQDITIETALLETRMIWGDRALFDSFNRLFYARFDAAGFIEGKLLEQKRRHLRFEDSAYNLEPNIKDSPGGLRDFHMIGWVTSAVLGTLSLSRHTSRDNTLVEAHLLSRSDVHRLNKIQGTLNILRIHLHLLAGRREDRLAFDYQNQLADSLGIHSTARYRASELLMRRYYRAAKQVQIANALLLPAMQELVSKTNSPLIPLDEDFALRNKRITVRDEDLFTRDPSALFRIFICACQHGVLDFDPTALRGIWRGRVQINLAFRESLQNRTAFMELLRQPRGVFRSLSILARFGVLGRYIPAFSRITGQMQHDGFHIYTVDEHTMSVLRNIRRFGIDDYKHEYPLASELISSFDKPELLYLGALFHDIAKGRGGDHSELGTHDARAFCRHHMLPDADVELVTWLVREHLSMSRTAQKEDLGDSAVIARFVAKVGNLRRLTALYILTVADIRGTSPKVWNAWKGKLLENLFYAARRRINGQSIAGLPEKMAEVRSKLALYGIQPDAANRFWESLEDNYFLRHDIADIAWHARMLWQNQDMEKPIVRTRLSAAGEGIQVLVYAPDAPDLFTRICGFFARNQFNVVEARIHTTQRGYALDSFQVLDDGQRQVLYRDFLQFVEYELTRALDRKIDPPPVPPGRVSRRLRHFPIRPEVELRPDEQSEFVVLSLTCGDRVGLLHDIAEYFQNHGIALFSAKIHTLGERVEDQFLLRGDMLDSAEKRLSVKRGLLSHLHCC